MVLSAWVQEEKCQLQFEMLAARQAGGVALEQVRRHEAAALEACWPQQIAALEAC